MKNKMINTETIEGKLFAHTLELKTAKSEGPNKGKSFIQGEIQIQVDDEGLNVIPVHYSYISEFTKAGKADRRFSVLTKIIETGKCVSVDGAANATLVSASPAIALNDYYNVQEEEFGSYPLNEGGFLNIIQPNTLKDTEDARSRFEVDAIITGIRPVEADEERGIEEHIVLKTGIFDYRKSFMPMEFAVYHPGAIQYFEGLDASSSNPVFTKLAGRVKSKQIVKIVTEESAFGEPSVREVRRNIREWEVTWARGETYAFDDETTITAAELKKAIQDREVYLEDVKQKRLDYEAKKKKNSGGAAAVTASANTEFNF